MNNSKYISDKKPKIIQEERDNFIEKIVDGYGKKNPNKPKEHLQALIDFYNDPDIFLELQNIFLKKEFHRSIANEVSGDRWSEKQQ